MAATAAQCYAGGPISLSALPAEYRRHGALMCRRSPCRMWAGGGKAWDSYAARRGRGAAFAVRYLRPRLARQGMDEDEDLYLGSR
ncbi:hypothetical protein KCP75_23505 [Salmonella enterica subsp. enterica]|nr:hypothetical protein KCP75_23505 [Salmonella enterica subsp. enterica]